MLDLLPPITVKVCLPPRTAAYFVGKRGRRLQPLLSSLRAIAPDAFKLKMAHDAVYTFALLPPSTDAPSPTFISIALATVTEKKAALAHSIHVLLSGTPPNSQACGTTSLSSSPAHRAPWIIILSTDPATTYRALTPCTV